MEWLLKDLEKCWNKKIYARSEEDLKHKYILKHDSGLYVSDIKKGQHYYSEDVNEAYTFDSEQLANKIKTMLEDSEYLSVKKVSVIFQETDNYSSGGTNSIMS
jgi:hypothetical protein